MAKPPRWIGRRADAPASTYKKLSPSELRKRGLSPKAERYISSTGDLLSKRQYQLQQLRERTGKETSFWQRTWNYVTNFWRYDSPARARAARGKLSPIWEEDHKHDRLRKKAKGGPLSGRYRDMFDALASTVGLEEAVKLIYGPRRKKE